MDHAEQFGADSVELDILPQTAGETVDGSRGVVAGPIEAAVDAALYAGPQWLKHHHHCEG
jgi:hypothetical protein